MAADGRVVIKVESNANAAAKDFDRLDKSLDNTEKDAKSADRAFSSLSKTLSGAAVAGALVVLAKKIKDVSLDLVNLASEAEETSNKFAVTFSRVIDKAEEMANSISKNYGLANDETKKLLSNTADLLSGFGFTQQAALDLSVQTNKLAVDLASFTNLEGGAVRASEALTKALLGERESIKLLGIAILDEDVKAKVKALEISGKLTTQSEREKKAIATLQLAYEQSKNAIGDFSRSQNSFANQNRILEATIRDLKVSLGDELLPEFTRLTTTINNFLAENDAFIRKSLASFINYVDSWVRGMDKIIKAGEAFVKGFERFSIANEQNIQKLVQLDDESIIFKLQKINKEIESLTNIYSGKNIYRERLAQLAEQSTVLERELELRKAIGIVQEQNDKKKKSSKGNEEDVKKVTELTSTYEELTKKVKASRDAVLELASAQVVDVNKFNDAKTRYIELAKSLKEVNKSVELPDDAANKWEDLAKSIESSLESAFVASFSKGESLLTNLGNSFKALFVQLAAKAVALGLINLFTGGTGGFLGGAAGALTANAQGNAFDNGKITPFAKGGVVSSPQLFPMSNGTGLMGEAGAEAILPLKRTSTGDLGVQGTPTNVTVYNQTDSQIEVVQRPDNETDIFIRRVNAALANERTDGSFSSAMSRQQSSGVQAS